MNISDPTRWACVAPEEPEEAMEAPGWVYTQFYPHPP